MNTAMTAGMHHRWRERAAERAELEPGDAALDVCCGTGDLAFELARRVGPQGTVVGCDFSEPMLELARRKAAERGLAAGPLRVGRRAGAALRRRLVRRRHGRLRGPQPRRPGARPGRADARAEAGRAPGDPRDHPAAAPAAVDLLLAVVRPGRAAAGRAGRRPRRLHLPARVGEALPVAPAPGGDDGRRRASSGSATWCSPAGSSPSTRAARGRSRREPLRRPAAR